METKQPIRQKRTCECGTIFYTSQNKELCPGCESNEQYAPMKIEIDNMRSGGKKG